jgi:hypothetical protein
MKEVVMNRAFAQESSSVNALVWLSYVPSIGVLLFVTQLFTGPEFLWINMSNPLVAGVMIILSFGIFFIDLKFGVDKSKEYLILLYAFTAFSWLMISIFVFGPMLF